MHDNEDYLNDTLARLDASRCTTGMLADARRRVGGRVALQGNLDPCALHGTPDSIRTEAHRRHP